MRYNDKARRMFALHEDLGCMRKLDITNKDEGQRLDKYLKKYLSEANGSFVYKMLRKKNITLNDKKASGNEQVKEGDVISLYLSEETIDKFTASSREVVLPIIKTQENRILYKEYSIPILYEDDNVLFLNKPAGLLSQKAEKADVSLVEILCAYLVEREPGLLEQTGFRPGICNRLDRNTSGIVAAGKTVKGLQQLSDDIRNHLVEKWYRCIVHGRITRGGHLRGYLVKDSKKNTVEIKSDPMNKEKASYIETKFQPIQQFGNYTVLEVELITGKSHQIRAHLSSIGHPIVGDVKYGAPPTKGVKYQFLHAYQMHWGEGRIVTAPVPQPFMSFIEQKG